MSKTICEIQNLKRQWINDPCWDIENTEGFEEHKEELLKYRLQCGSEWEKERLEKEKLIDEEVKKVGIKGIYRMIKKHNELLERQERAIELLVDGNAFEAYKALKGYCRL